MGFTQKVKTCLAGGLIIGSLAFSGYTRVEAAGRVGTAESTVAAMQAELAQQVTKIEQLELAQSEFKVQWARELERRQAFESQAGQRIATKVPQAPQAQQIATSTPTTVGFSDVAGIFAEQTVLELAQAGVLDQTSGEFRPNDTITRAEFLRWLVKSNNFVTTNKDQIRLAEDGSTQFSDVPVGHEDYRYIQGAASAGFVIGYDQTTFAPDRELSREEMIAIKISFDKAEAQMNGNCGPRYTDFEQVAEKYRQAVHNCDNSYYGGENAKRIWGSIKTFHPTKKVTRAEAALCVAKVKGFESVAEVLAKKATNG